MRSVTESRVGDSTLVATEAPFPDALRDRKGGPVEIHTSDRISYRRCRRRWWLSSRQRLNLEPDLAEVRTSLWFGTGFHFALEDFHGRQLYSSAADAFRAYAEAFSSEERPVSWEDLVDLAAAMLEYYQSYWLPRRDGEFETLWIGSVPQVEVAFQIPLGVFRRNGRRFKVLYAGTFDAVLRDRYGRLWVAEYKTAARLDTDKLPTDPQASAYIWAATQIYGAPFEGIVYQQFRKEPPRPPSRLQDGSFSTDSRQATTHALYRKALLDEFGQIPPKYLQFLNALAEREDEYGDRYIRRDLVRRNASCLDAETRKMRAEIGEMLSLRTPLYPNPTRECAWDCAFRAVCLAMDDGSDWTALLAGGYRRKEEARSWRKRLGYPEPEQKQYVPSP